MTRASFPCPKCGSAFKTFEGLAIEGRHWHKGPDGRWYDTTEA